jgi:hypothetical protein
MAPACLGSDNDGLGCVSLFCIYIGYMVLHSYNYRELDISEVRVYQNHNNASEKSLLLR